MILQSPSIQREATGVLAVMTTVVEMARLLSLRRYTNFHLSTQGTTVFNTSVSDLNLNARWNND
jgi:hypothetical protein